MPRKASIARKPKDTQIELELNLDGDGVSQISTGVGFLDHMLDLFAKHGKFDLKVEAQGDLHIDQHHTVEDIGICLGQVFGEALGNKQGIRRYGFLFFRWKKRWSIPQSISADELSGCSMSISPPRKLETSTPNSSTTSGNPPRAICRATFTST